jgi:hypothetical protein
LICVFHVRFRWQLRPRQITGDTKYGTIENIKAIEDAHIHASVPLPDWEHQTSYYGPSRFTYDETQDHYTCPQGQLLRPFRWEYKAEKVEYRASSATCNACPLKAQCTPSNSGRQVHRSFHAAYLERVKNYHQTEACLKAMRKRKVWVEPLFAEAKDWHGMRRFRLWRLWRVNCEALVIAAGQNLKHLLTKRGWGRRPFPTDALCIFFGAFLSDSLLLFLGEASFLLPICSAFLRVLREYLLSADELSKDFFNRLERF